MRLLLKVVDLKVVDLAACTELQAHSYRPAMAKSSHYLFFLGRGRSSKPNKPAVALR